MSWTGVFDSFFNLVDSLPFKKTAVLPPTAKDDNVDTKLLAGRAQAHISRPSTRAHPYPPPHVPRALRIPQKGPPAASVLTVAPNATDVSREASGSKMTAPGSSPGGKVRRALGAVQDRVSSGVAPVTALTARSPSVKSIHLPTARVPSASTTPSSAGPAAVPASDSMDVDVAPLNSNLHVPPLQSSVLVADAPVPPPAPLTAIAPLSVHTARASSDQSGPARRKYNRHRAAINAPNALKYRRKKEQRSAKQMGNPSAHLPLAPVPSTSSSVASASQNSVPVILAPLLPAAVIFDAAGRPDVGDINSNYIVNHSRRLHASSPSPSQSSVSRIAPGSLRTNSYPYSDDSDDDVDMDREDTVASFLEETRSAAVFEAHCCPPDLILHILEQSDALAAFGLDDVGGEEKLTICFQDNTRRDRRFTGCEDATIALLRAHPLVLGAAKVVYGDGLSPHQLATLRQTCPVLARELYLHLSGDVNVMHAREGDALAIALMPALTRIIITASERPVTISRDGVERMLRIVEGYAPETPVQFNNILQGGRAWSVHPASFFLSQTL
ncbi:hypothetical protein EXIGLDRAFT_736618 [Exidia glandulosa HHB12029]|uniref:Uncharacterized protein n=1 Tax=Exidia glandulosa HHB12029 TaxID=1314781 RepID=A0A165JB18_EXIGL|nr:hypothetical protein EXIGLDRAFT_736618 [Exidia glandulosa HHB12029]